MTGLLPPNPLSYEGQVVVPFVNRNTDPTTSFINFNVPTIWINTSNGNIWMLVGKALKIADWVLLGTGASGPTIGFTVPAGSTPVYPDTGTGLVTFTSTSGTIAITGTTHSINFDLVGGGVAIESLLVQAATSPGVTTVTPSSGQITVNAAAVAAHSVPIESRSRALHAYNIEAQIASTVSPTPANTNSVGLVCFNDAQFTVDATSGMASLKGSTSLAPILTETGNSGGAVSPNASGNINVVGDGVTATVVGNPGTNTLTISTVNALPANQYTNLGFTYSGGIFKVTSEDGTALSATNAAQVRVPSTLNPGKSVIYTITADQSFHDATGSSDIIGNLFGFTSGVAITVDVPFFVYAIPDSTESTIAFMIGRTNNKQQSPAAGNIGVPGTPGTNNQTSLFSIPAVTAANYAGNTCVCIGSFRMKMSASNDWTVQSFSSADGVGEFNNRTVFSYPLGQFGTNAGTITNNNGGTAAVFTTTTATYMLKLDGICWTNAILSGDGGTDGAGAVFAQVMVPFQSNQQNFASGIGIRAAGASQNLLVYLNSNINFVSWAENGADYLQWQAYTNGNRNWNAAFGYPITP